MQPPAAPEIVYKLCRTKAGNLRKLLENSVPESSGAAKMRSQRVLGRSQGDPGARGVPSGAPGVDLGAPGPQFGQFVFCFVIFV